MRNKILNPFYSMVLIISISLTLYKLELSKIYPHLSIELILFFGFIIFILIMYGVLFRYSLKAKLILNFYFNKSKVRLMLIILFLIYALEIIYSKQIPLISSIAGQKSDYKNFGFPTVHVFVQTFNIFLSSIISLWFALTRNKKIFFLYLLTLMPFVLLMTRGMLVVSVLISSFIYLTLNKLSKKNLILLTFLIITAIFIFSLSGNLRINGDYNSGYNITDSTLILNIGKANNFVYSLGIFSSLFWIYLYMSSPLANLQLTCDTFSGGNSLTDLIVTQWLPDFLSKRVIELTSIPPQQSVLITPELTVSTAFVGSYAYFGWIGMFITAIFLISILFFILLFLYKSINYGYFIIGNAIVTTICFTSMFDNMWTFAGLNLPLLFCVLSALFIPNFLFSITINSKEKALNCHE